MSTTNPTVIRSISIKRRSLIELIIVAILLAFGINLIVGQLINLSVLSPMQNVAIGVFVCFCSILYYIASLIGKRFVKRSYNAFFLYDKKKNDIIPVPRYEFSEYLYKYFKGAFIENSALKKLWNEKPIKDLQHADFEGKDNRIQSVELILEAAEHFLLSRLSTHLIDFFDNEKFKESNLKEYVRKDVPDVLLSNRFLELFSRPLDERPAFSDQYDKNSEGILCLATGKGGALYERFDLVLPKESTIKRPKAHKIEINTKKLKMFITVRFEGFCTVLPCDFLEYYLGIKNHFDITEYKLDIDIEVKMKIKFIFSKIGWEYYQWIDSFLEEIEKDISQRKFFEVINWESTLTTLKCLECEKKK